MLKELFCYLRKNFHSPKIHNKYGFFVPNSYVLWTIDKILELLEEIVKAQQMDLNSNKDLLQNVPQLTPQEYMCFEVFKLRGLWRIGSFIIFALNLEGILIQEYKKLMTIHSHLGFQSEIYHKNLLHQRKAEIEKYRLYRNKIFAHTAFGSLQKNDNDAMKRK